MKVISAYRHMLEWALETCQHDVTRRTCTVCWCECCDSPLTKCDCMGGK